MRKLRDDITLQEAWNWLTQHGPGCWDVSILGNIIGGVDRDDYPDSFYEDPPIGSFGKFWDGPRLDKSVWGYLMAMTGVVNYPYNNGVAVYEHFEPGLPTDVDKNGYPKEK